MNSDSTQIRLGVLGIAALSLFGALFARLWFLQIVSADDYQALVNRTSTKVVTVAAPRGRILDRNGIALVANRSSVVVTVDTQQFDKMEPEQQERLLDRLATEISASRPKGPKATVKSLRQRLNDQRFSHLRPVPVASDVPESLEILLKERADEFPAVEAERLTVRAYPYGRSPRTSSATSARSATTSGSTSATTTSRRSPTGRPTRSARRARSRRSRPRCGARRGASSTRSTPGAARSASSRASASSPSPATTST